MAETEDTEETLRAEWEALFNRTLEFGRRAGEQAAVQRIVRAATGQPQQTTLPLRHRERPAHIPEAQPKIVQVKEKLPYGAKKASVLQAIQAHPQGIGTGEIPSYCKENLGLPLTYSQVVEAIKSLSDKEKIVSKDRKWFPAQ
jgi:hypothetical protein